jgi:hypothetical protein
MLEEVALEEVALQGVALQEAALQEVLVLTPARAVLPALAQDQADFPAHPLEQPARRGKVTFSGVYARWAALSCRGWEAAAGIFMPTCVLTMKCSLASTTIGMWEAMMRMDRERFR